MPRIRVHQHVNPLATFFRNLMVAPLEIGSLFEKPDLPLFIDIGSARGRFLLRMAEIESGKNFLGLEIRQPLVDEANRLAREAGLTNLHYEFCNATIALGGLLENLPAGLLQNVTIQFPDPWFKKKHAKRRMVKEEMVEIVVDHLNTAGRIFAQTDVEFLANEMFELFRQNEFVREIEISENPYPVKTEREGAVEENKLPVYRAMFEKIAA